MAYDVKIEIRLLINRIEKIEIAGGGTRNILDLHGREGGRGSDGKKIRRFTQGEFHSHSGRHSRPLENPVRTVF